MWVRNNITRIVYDIGAELRANQTIVRSLFYSRLYTLKRDKPILVISHWDIDHYHCLECASIQEIRTCFSKVVCMDMMKSLTSQRIYKKILYALGSNNVFCIKPALRTNGRELEILPFILENIVVQLTMRDYVCLFTAILRVQFLQVM